MLKISIKILKKCTKNNKTRKISISLYTLSTKTKYNKITNKILFKNFKSLFT